jgi:hypothetical protein
MLALSLSLCAATDNLVAAVTLTILHAFNGPWSESLTAF